MVTDANCAEVHVPVKSFPPVNVATAVVGTEIAPPTVVVPFPPAALLAAWLAHPMVLGIVTLTPAH